MIENIHLGDAIDAIGTNMLKYDKYVKEILAGIQILSRIIKNTVIELHRLSLEEIQNRVQCVT